MRSEVHEDANIKPLAIHGESIFPCLDQTLSNLEPLQGFARR